LTIRSLWDLFPDIESALTGALASANAPKPAAAKTAKPAQKLVDESAKLRAQVAELQKQLAELNKK